MHINVYQRNISKQGKLQSIDMDDKNEDRKHRKSMETDKKTNSRPTQTYTRLHTILDT